MSDKKDKLPLIHPGEILLEEFMEPLGISRNKLGRDLGAPAQRISQIVKGERGITLDTALRLGEYFGTTAKFWLNLQVQYDLRLAAETKLEEKIRAEVRKREAA